MKVLWKCADVPRNSTTLHTCAEGDHLLEVESPLKFEISFQVILNENKKYIGMSENVQCRM